MTANDLREIASEFREAWRAEVALKGDEPDTLFDAVMNKVSTLADRIRALPESFPGVKEIKAAERMWRQEDAADLFPAACKLLATP